MLVSSGMTYLIEPQLSRLLVHELLPILLHNLFEQLTPWCILHCYYKQFLAVKHLQYFCDTRVVKILRNVHLFHQIFLAACLLQMSR